MEHRISNPQGADTAVAFTAYESVSHRCLKGADRRNSPAPTDLDAIADPVDMFLLDAFWRALNIGETAIPAVCDRRQPIAPERQAGKSWVTKWRPIHLRAA